MSRSYEERLLEYMRRYREVGAEVKRILRKIDPDVRVFVFGSVVRGRYTAASDIDILVVTDDLSKKYEMMVEVYRSVEAPVELHITTPQKYRSWYSRFIPLDELVEI
uniref:DNA polymerase beta domain protein region n=1 Tax=Caldiarchaeum subterraneum TaxID=311458 RepID=E6NAQ0_CALS0|nr:DNA polymerase beta domain protein region [Candidatus Caldarchaeum subterraneum]